MKPIALKVQVRKYLINRSCPDIHKQTQKNKVPSKEKTKDGHQIISFIRKIRKAPEAAAPQTTPQISGAQVTGFVSCKRIFHLSCESKCKIS